MKKMYTCIVCPNGCDMEVDVEQKEIRSITGHTCPRGEAYVRQEITAPKRTIASSVAVENGILPLASVRLTRPVPREALFQVMDAIKAVTLTAPAEAGTVIIRQVCGLDSDVIVTRNVPAKN